MTDGGEDLTRKYHLKYEEHTNPFKDWASREKHRRYANMGPADRIIMSMVGFRGDPLLFIMRFPVPPPRHFILLCIVPYLAGQDDSWQQIGTNWT